MTTIEKILVLADLLDKKGFHNMVNQIDGLIKHATVSETNKATEEHINNVRNFIFELVVEILERAKEHDRTKLESPEVEIFDEFTDKLSSSTYGSPEYKEFLRQMKPALDHHYQVYRHHPEHFKNGIDDMNLIDLIEMMADWRAASERHKDGDVSKSLEINTDRFNISPQLKSILKNTLECFK